MDLYGKEICGIFIWNVSILVILYKVSAARKKNLEAAGKNNMEKFPYKLEIRII